MPLSRLMLDCDCSLRKNLPRNDGVVATRKVSASWATVIKSNKMCFKRAWIRTAGPTSWRKVAESYGLFCLCQRTQRHSVPLTRDRSRNWLKKRARSVCVSARIGNRPTKRHR